MSQGFELVSTREDVKDQNDPPPANESLLRKVREARKSATGVKDFLPWLIRLILGTLVGTIILSISAVIPISMLIIGIVYLKNCPAEPHIPIYLIVAGGFGVLKELLEFFARYPRKRNKQELDENGEKIKQNKEKHQQTPLDKVISLFLFAWFIAGCVWIYRAYEPEYVDTSSDHYCDKTLYLFSFWITAAVFIIFGFALMFLCCICITLPLLEYFASRN